MYPRSHSSEASTGPENSSAAGDRQPELDEPETSTETTTSATGPLFSVIVPSHNRPRELARCLWSLAASTFAHDQFEVIVVDDGGTEPLEPVVKPFRDRLDI